MTINDFLKAIQKHFGEVEYKITTIDGVTFRKTKGWRDDKVVANQRQLTNASGEVEST
jgi:hypothetical protein